MLATAKALPNVNSLSFSLCYAEADDALFECTVTGTFDSLDESFWTSCDSGFEYPMYQAGVYIFTVRVVDSVGNVATYKSAEPIIATSFVPVIALNSTSLPDIVTSDGSVSLSFYQSEDEEDEEESQAGFLCQLQTSSNSSLLPPQLQVECLALYINYIHVRTVLL